MAQYSLNTSESWPKTPIIHSSLDIGLSAISKQCYMCNMAWFVDLNRFYSKEKDWVWLVVAVDWRTSKKKVSIDFMETNLLGIGTKILEYTGIDIVTLLPLSGQNCTQA